MIQALPPDSKVVRRLIEYIRSRRLMVGDRLPAIRRLAKMIEMSPRAVRDGLMQAQTMGLVTIRPRSGAFVQSVSYASLVDGNAQQACLEMKQLLGMAYRSLLQRVEHPPKRSNGQGKDQSLADD
jgi:DNA-binding FadR family transcriptional regulator